MLPGLGEEEATAALAAARATAAATTLAGLSSSTMEELPASQLPYRNAFLRRGGRRLILIFSDMRFVTAETHKFQLLRTAATTFPHDDVLILRDDTRDTWYLAKADALKAGLHAFVREHRYDSVCAFGSSSGGFAVLAFAAGLPGFKAAVLLVPQGCMWELQRDRVPLGDCCSLLAGSLAHLYPSRFDLLAPVHSLPPTLARGSIMWSYNSASASDVRLASHVDKCLGECCSAPGGRAGGAAAAGPNMPPAIGLAPFSAPGVGHGPSIAARATPDWFVEVVRPHFDAYAPVASAESAASEEARKPSDFSAASRAPVGGAGAASAAVPSTRPCADEDPTSADDRM